MAEFKEISDLPVGAEEKPRETSVTIIGLQPRFELGTSRLRSRTLSASAFGPCGY
jgi:hypothetical protein